MKAHVQKWGNSLAIRIPRPLALDSHLVQGSLVELSVENGRLVIAAAATWSDRLDLLLKDVTSENSHPETDFGQPMGHEVW